MLVGTAFSARAHEPSRQTSYAGMAHGTPLATSASGASISWKCRCGAVELPVCPTLPSTSPTRTIRPTSTATVPVVRWAKAA